MWGQLWCQLWLEYLSLWEAKSGQLGLWELGEGASCGFGSWVLKVWLEYILPGGLRGASGVS